MILVLTGVCALTAGLSCPSETRPASSRPPAREAELTVFFTGEELGSLRPCGCSGGQLGGLEKRAAIFDTVPAQNRLLVATGALTESDREQELIKFGILFEALRYLRYDVVHLTARDLDIAVRLGLPADEQQAFKIIGPTGAGQARVFTKQFAPQGREIAVRIAALDPQIGPLDSVAGLFDEIQEGVTLDILILGHYDPASIEALAAQAPGLSCVVCPSDSDEPRLLSKLGVKPLVFTVGRFGRYVCRVEAAVQRTGELALRFEPIPVQAKLPDDERLVQLYRQYQQLVRDSNLLERHPRLPLPGDLAFVGSGACKRCHEHEYDRWSTKAHANALASLKEVGSDHDPECVICHVVGLDYERGYVTEARTPHLKDVGCENCHGPGSQHVLTAGEQATVEPKMACLACHTPEKSTGYAGHEEEYMQKIVHWREPTAAGNVKD